MSTSSIAIPDLLVPQLAQPVRIGIFSVNFAQDRRDNPANAHRGIYNTLDLGVASSIFGSQRNFVRALARNATYHQLPWHMVLARELTFGVIKSFDISSALSAADAVPLPERFFGGGNLTNRGFGKTRPVHATSERWLARTGLQRSPPDSPSAVTRFSFTVPSSASP